MLVIPLKCPPRFDLREPLAKWLDGGSSSCNDSPANPLAMTILRPDFKSCSCRDELVRLASLRNCLSESIAKPNSHKVALEEMALQDLHEYHAALVEFIKRGFPSSDVVTVDARLELTWKASIGPQKETHGSLEWDRACAIWNIAALESYLASIQPPDTKEGRKQAVMHCQKAAAMMKYLQDTILSQPAVNKFTTVDLSVPSLKFWESYMLAQAQLAAYQVALDNPNAHHSVLSYLAMGAVPLWNDALKYSKEPLLVSQLPAPAKEWSVHCKSWSIFLSATAAHHQAMAAQQAQNWGAEIAWLQTTLEQFQACNAFLISSSGEATTAGINEEFKMQTNVTSNISLVEERLAEATRDNHLLYGEQVPTTTSLPTILAKQLVKSEMEALPESMTTPKVALFK